MLQKNKYNTFNNIFCEEWLGVVDFKMSLERQRELRARAKKGQFTFVGFEPKNTVITKGLSATSEDILWDDHKLKDYHIDQLPLKRGGQATLHSHGQLVVYPIISLHLLGIKVKNFILSLEAITQSVLKDLQIDTQSLDRYAGLSTSEGKIAFFGIHISEGVSQHGLSINVCNDLNLFSAIKSCGLKQRRHDSLSNQHINNTTESLFYRWIQKAKLFYTNGI